MKKFDLLNSIKEKFSNYKTYYEILGIKPEEATDEKVKNIYEEKLKQLEFMFKDYNNEAIKEVEELIKTSLDNAYTALKSENSRRNYDELLKKIQASPKGDDQSEL